MIYDLDGREVDAAYIRPTITINLGKLEKEIRKLPFVLDVMIFRIPDYKYGTPVGNIKRILIFLNINEGAQREWLLRDGPPSDDPRLNEEWIELQIRHLYSPEVFVRSYLMDKFGWHKKNTLLEGTNCIGDMPISSFIVDLEDGEDFKSKAQKLAQKKAKSTRKYFLKEKQ